MHINFICEHDRLTKIMAIESILLCSTLCAQPAKTIENEGECYLWKSFMLFQPIQSKFEDGIQWVPSWKAPCSDQNCLPTQWNIVFSMREENQLSLNKNE